MAFNFTKEQLKAAFDEAAGAAGAKDTLNLVEFGELLIKLVGSDRLTSEQVQVMFADIAGPDAEMSFDEMWTQITAEPVKKSDLEKYFKEADKDGSGCLTKDEITALFAALANPMPQEAIDKALADADANDDGKINISEFLALFEY